MLDLQNYSHWRASHTAPKSRHQTSLTGPGSKIKPSDVFSGAWKHNQSGLERRDAWQQKSKCQTCFRDACQQPVSQLEPFGSTGGLAASIINAFGGLTANQSIRRVLEAWQHNQTGLEAPEVWQQQPISVTALVRHCLVISLGPSAAAAVTEAIVRKTQRSNNLSFQQREAWNVSKLFCFAGMFVLDFEICRLGA